ncbi:MAG: Fimbrial assembly protein (PilN) [Smithella sp. PtaU1.Bin162]|nr:MAG: Fimbrial assembly protein (PilN) [Smithella sp. PtaU1.Bin162]
MIDYRNKMNSAFVLLDKYGRLLWKYLSFSLADNFFSITRVVCISIEADGIYLVFGTKIFWKISVKYFKKLPLEEDKALTPEYLATVVSRALVEMDAPKVSFVLSIPKAWTIVQVAEFPITAKENLANVISYELDRLTPLTPENAYYDYKIIAESQKKISVLLNVAKADQINPFLEALHSKNIKIEKLSISGSPVKVAINDNAQKYKVFFDKLSPVPVFNLDRNNKLGLPEGGKDISPFALGCFWETVNADQNEFNLLAGKNGNPKKTPFVLTAVLLAVILLICAFYVLAPILIEQKKIEQISDQINSLKPEIKKVKALKKEIEAISSDIKTISNFKKHSILTMDILKEITTILPVETWLTRTRITESSVEIEGYAVQAADIISKLENSRYFQKAEFASPTFRDPRQNKERFVIRMELKNENRLKKQEERGKKNEKKK